ncbi:DUF5057 domain-containing protein [Caldicellulosiruptoraceae bacterium PP1]
MKNKKLFFLVPLLIIGIIITFLLTNKLVYGGGNSNQVINDNINILEIIPDFKDTPALKTFINNNKSLFPNINVTSITLNQFNSMRNDVNGEYDIVYFGKGNYGLVSGSSDSNNPNGANNSTTVIPRRYNDITNLRAKPIKDMLNSNQAVIFDVAAFSKTDTNLYSNFNSLVPTSKRTNIDSFDYDKFISQIYNRYQSSNKKLIVNNFQKPNEDIEYKAGDTLTFSFNVKNPNNNSNNYTAKLYIDLNRDGLFKSDELKSVQPLNNYNTLSNVTFTMPLVYSAPIYWKLELVALDSNYNETKIKRVFYGKVKYKGIEINANVLQIAPTQSALSSLNLKTKFENTIVDGHPLGKNPGYFNLSVIPTYSSDFQSSFTTNKNRNDGNYPKYRELSKYFDMIIFGFNDCYAGGDITNSDAMKQIWDYYSRGLGLMLTHDTIWYVQDTNSNFPLNLSRYFVNEVGQAFKNQDDYNKLISNDIYKYTNPPYIPNNNGTPGQGFSTEYMRYTYYRVLSGLGGVTGGGTFTSSTKVNKINSGVINEYPYKLNDSIDVGTTHDMYYTLNLEDEDVIPWYNLDVSSNKDDTNSAYYYYTYSTKNITFSGTGHAPNEIANKTDELKMFVNTVIKAYLAVNHKPDINIIKPENNATNPYTISNKIRTIDISFVPLDYDISDAGALKVEVYMKDINNNYQLLKTFTNLNSGSEINDSINNIYYNQSVDNLNKTIKFKVIDSDNAFTEVEIPIKIVNQRILTKPTLNYNIFQNTGTPKISGSNVGESSDYNNNFRVYITIKDNNGNVVNNNNNLLALSSAGSFEKVITNNLSETIDFNKPYKVEVYQKYPATETGLESIQSPIETGDLYIDLHSPIIDNLTIYDNVRTNPEFNVNLSGNNIVYSYRPTFKGQLTDNDPEVRGSIILQKYDPVQGTYIDIASQPLSSGNFSFTPSSDIQSGNYRISITGWDRAGNYSNVLYNISVGTHISSVNLLSNRNTINTNNSTISISLTINAIANLTQVIIPIDVVNTTNSYFYKENGVIYVTTTNSNISFANKTANSFDLIISNLPSGTSTVKFTLKIKTDAKDKENLIVKLNAGDGIIYNYGSYSGLQYQIPSNIILNIPVKKMILR